MPPDKAKDDTTTPNAGAPAAPPAPLRARDLWPIPVALLGLGLAIAGIMVLARAAPGPDNKGVISDAAALLSRQSYAQALDVLNGPITQTIGAPEVDPALRAEYHALRGEAIYLAGRSARKGSDDPAANTNSARALEEFDTAQRLSPGALDPRRRALRAGALIDLDKLHEAERQTLDLPLSEGPRRRSLLRAMIDRVLEGPPAFHARAFALMERLKSEPDLPEEDRAWVVARRAGAMLDDGNHQAAIEMLLPEVQRLSSLAEPAAGELLLLLGRAHIDAGNLAPAREQLARAETVFVPGDQRRGIIEALLGRIAQNKGELEEARDRFANVVERFPGDEAQAIALLGRAETDADMGRHADALIAYGKLITMLPKLRTPLGITPGALDASLAQRHRARIVAQDYPTALEYAKASLACYPPSQAPPAAVERLAQTHLRLGEELLGGLSQEPDLALHLRSLDSDQVEAARVHFESAGNAYREHAQKAMVNDPDAASASLWNAADSFDRAGNRAAAIELFTQFVQTHKNADRVLGAKFRLARCFQADNQYDTAVGLFEEILRQNPDSDEAFRAHVPLAQCYLLRSADADNQKAESMLLSVLNGRRLGPDAPEFKRALIELGTMYLRLGRAAPAIARLREALDRYPESAQRTRLQFDLADALRLSAASTEKQLMDAMPVADREQLATLRRQRLQEAQGLYEQVRSALERAEPGSLTAVQRLILRNAIFYRGDCAYDLGDFDGAIRQYDAAAQRYADDPASLVAMVQIVNCYASLGKTREARTAHTRAQLRLKELPDDSWQAAMTPMDRRHWERWLDTSLRLERAADAQAAAPAK